MRIKRFLSFILLLGILALIIQFFPGFTSKGAGENLKLNEQEYFEMQGLNVMVFQDYYPEGHQGGISIIQNGERIATNGDIRLEATPGQWQPVPKMGKREVDKMNNMIKVYLTYPDSSKNLKGYNPIVYPNLYFNYKVYVTAIGKDIKITVDLDRAIPDEFIGKVGFNMELFPTPLFGKRYYMDNQTGMFPRQANGPVYFDGGDTIEMTPMAVGKKLVIVPENNQQRVEFESLNGELKLIDGRGVHNNGWFVVRSEVKKGAKEKAIEWIIRPSIIDNFISKPVIEVSQVGYHPKQGKIANVELDKYDKDFKSIELHRINNDGSTKVVKKQEGIKWGKFLRYNYLQFDFSEITEPGIYQICYGDQKSHTFEIKNEIFDRHVWQPVLEYFLPVQMCHMRINDRYKVWHGLCHMDDALMAPINYTHFDGYKQGESTLCKYKPGDAVPGLASGGWHDAGDYDLRVESQAGTVKMLALAIEEFGIDYDQTTIDQKKHLVEMHRPDGVSDALQQIEHGVLTILSGYKSMGRLYRGIIESTLRQYVMLGDAASMTDNLVFDPELKNGQRTATTSGVKDDRWVFTEVNPRGEIQVAGNLALAGRTLKKYRPELARECIETAETIWESLKTKGEINKNEAAIELYKSTGKEVYMDYILSRKSQIIGNIGNEGPVIARLIDQIKDKAFVDEITEAVKKLKEKIETERKENPYGVPYKPYIWGAGWGIQNFGVQQYYLHKGFPKQFNTNYMLDALNFILGVHPGNNTASFASGVGSNSLIVAYGVNRDEWTYIPGGVASGTALIRPDFAELKEWPYFWQQTEYVMGGGSLDFMFLVLAAKHTLDNN
jgi:endoglucanase